jgi:hypothetical protein
MSVTAGVLDGRVLLAWSSRCGAAFIRSIVTPGWNHG